MLTMGQILYRQYLRSPHWRRLRNEAFAKYGYKCSKCPSVFKLQPHHHTYRSPWESCTVEDLVILCRVCHRKEHGLPEITKPRKKKKFKKINFKKLNREKLRKLKEAKAMKKYSKAMGVKW